MAQFPISVLIEHMGKLVLSMIDISCVVKVKRLIYMVIRISSKVLELCKGLMLCILHPFPRDRDSILPYILELTHLGFGHLLPFVVELRTHVIKD
jgi:hypothetical protein